MNFEEIYRFYWPKIFRLCMGYVNDRAWAKDIAQDTFINVLKELPQFRNESSIGTWIFRIATNNCLRQLKKENKNPKAQLLHDVEDEVGPDIESKLQLLFKYIAELPEIDRIIISLELEELKQAEIAKIVELSEANIRVRIHRIKEKLSKKLLKDE